MKIFLGMGNGTVAKKYSNLGSATILARANRPIGDRYIRWNEHFKKIPEEGTCDMWPDATPTQRRRKLGCRKTLEAEAQLHASTQRSRSFKKVRDKGICDVWPAAI